MHSAVYERIRKNPKYQEFVARRARFAMRLSAVVLLAYYGFMMVVAFAPDLLRAPLDAGAATTIGWPVGAAIIIAAWLLTGWYVYRANGEFDALNAAVIEEATR